MKLLAFRAKLITSKLSRNESLMSQAMPKFAKSLEAVCGESEKSEILPGQSLRMRISSVATRSAFIGVFSAKASKSPSR